MAYNVGLVGPYDHDGVIAPDFFAATMIYFLNRTPLVTRLPDRPVSGLVIKAVDDQYRPTTSTLTDANGITNSATAITVATDQGLQFMPGDVVEVDSELFLVTASAATSLTVTGGHAGSTRAAHNTNSTIYLIGNTRTGSEVDQDGMIRVFDTSSTQPQTSQHVYQVGGSTQASSENMAIPMGMASYLGYERAKAVQELYDDFERSIVYGQAISLASDTTRPMMRGVRQRLTTNNVTSPTSGSAYKPSDFERDFLDPCYTGGGNPDVVILAQNFRAGFTTWGYPIQFLNPGKSGVGVNVQTWHSTDLRDINIIFSPMLRSGHGIALTSEEVYMGWKRKPFDKPRGSRGDATEGDVIGEGCVVLNNQAHHAWVQGVTGFAKQS